MPALFDVGEIAGDLIDSIGDAADGLFTSEEERKRAKLAIKSRLLEHKEKLATERAKTVRSETSGHWYQRAWRPFTMVVFVGVIVAHWFGVAGTHLDPAIQEWLYKVIQLGLGGYVFGRSAGKIAPHARDAITGRKSHD